MHNNFRFLVDSSTLLIILPHADVALPTGLHLVGANGKTIPAWGFRHFTICFSVQNFEFHFHLAAIATPLLGMDFLSHQNSTFCPLPRAAHSPRQFVSPWSSETATGIAIAQVISNAVAAHQRRSKTSPRRCPSHQHR
jgi:hypothetical protein